jgi:group I intron endonuclease
VKCGIYGIKNLITGKWYVGQSVRISLRRAQHFSDLRHNRSRSEHLQCSFNKYGEASFEFHIIEEVAEDMLDMREKAWIRYYKSNQREFGYNQEAGGNLLKHISESTRNRLSFLHKNNPAIIKRCREMAKAQKGKPLSKKHRDRIAEGMKGEKNHNYGKKFSVKHRKNLSKSHQGKKNWNYGKPRPEATRRKISDSEKITKNKKGYKQ